MAEKYPSMEYSVTLNNGVWYGYWGTHAHTESARRYQARWGSDTVSYFENFETYSAAREFVLCSKIMSAYARNSAAAKQAKSRIDVQNDF